MTTVIETCALLQMDNLLCGELKSLIKVMDHPHYEGLEYDQLNSKSVKLFSNITLDDRYILIFVFGS